MTLTLYDSMGRTIMQNRFTPETTHIDMRNLPKGLYVMVDDTGASHKILYAGKGD